MSESFARHEPALIFGGHEFKFIVRKEVPDDVKAEGSKMVNLVGTKHDWFYLATISFSLSTL